MKSLASLCLLLFPASPLLLSQSPDNEATSQHEGLPASFFIWAALITLVTVYTIYKFRKTFNDEEKD